MNRTPLTLALGILAAIGLAAAQPASAQVTIVNNSFEANGVGGYEVPTGWTAFHPVGSGSYGIDGPDWSGVFANNGTIPDGSHVAFLQNGGSGATTLSQDLSGFTTGDQYVVTFYDNARYAYGDALLNVTLGGTTIVPNTDVAPVNYGIPGPYNFVTAAPFTATGSTATLTFSSLVTSSGDATVLLDDVNITDITAAPEPSQFAALAIGLLGLGALALKARKRTPSSEA